MASTARETTAAEALARAYFEALDRHDLDAATEMWVPGGIDRFVGQFELVAPQGVRDYFAEVFGALPDFSLRVLSVVANEEGAAVRWRATGTFAGPGRFQGPEPTGARVDVEGCDVLTVRDGRIEHNDAYLDGADMARQLGVLPARDSSAERGLTAAVNIRSRLAQRVSDEPEQIANGVWTVRGGVPRKGFNVYFVRDGDGVLMFDAGIRAMTGGLAATGARLGGPTRIVLGHPHPDHRGAAAGLAGVPVHCHPTRWPMPRATAAPATCACWRAGTAAR